MNRTVDSSPDSLSILSCPLDFENLTECLQSVNCSTDKVLGIRCSSFGEFYDLVLLFILNILYLDLTNRQWSFLITDTLGTWFCPL